MALVLFKIGPFLYQAVSFVIEVLSTAIIFILAYTLAKILQDNTLKVESFVIFIFVFAVLINASIWIEEIFVKHLKLIRTSIIIDILIVIACLSVVISSQFTQVQSLVSASVINQLDSLRSLEDTFDIYKTILNVFEKCMNCCRVPSLVSKKNHAGEAIKQIIICHIANDKRHCERKFLKINTICARNVLV